MTEIIEQIAPPSLLKLSDTKWYKRNEIKLGNPTEMQRKRVQIKTLTLVHFCIELTCVIILSCTHQGSKCWGFEYNRSSYKDYIKS